MDSSLPGRIDPADDEDLYKIVTTEDTDLWVYTTGDLDTVGELTDSRGDVVDSNDDGRLPPAALRSPGWWRVVKPPKQRSWTADGMGGAL